MTRIGVLLAVFVVVLYPLSGQQKSFLQFAHTSADLAIPAVDVYIDDVLVHDNLTYKFATTFIEVTSDVEHVIALAQENSSSHVQNFYSTKISLTPSSRNILFLQGALIPAEYQSNPDPDAASHQFTLMNVPDVRNGSSKPDYIDFFFYNACFDSPKLDIFQSTSKAASGVSFGGTSSYFSSSNPSVMFGISAQGNQPFASFGADLAAYKSQSAVLAACGFINPSVNKGGDLFGMFVVPAAGGAFKQLSPGSVPPLCKVQFINASADPSLPTVDVYWNNELVLDDLNSKTATQYFDYYQQQNARLVVAPGSSSNVADSIGTLTVSLAAGRHAIIFSGLTEPSNFAPNSDPLAAPTRLAPYHIPGISPSALSPTDIDIQFFHAATDLGRIALKGSFTSDEFSYGHAASVITTVASETTVDVISVPENQGKGRFVCRFPQFAGSSITAVVYGFENSVLNNNGPSFELFAAPPSGGSLVRFPNVLTSVPDYVQIEEGRIADVWYNPNTQNICFRTVSPESPIAEVYIVSTLGSVMLHQSIGNGLGGSLLEFDVSVKGWCNGPYFVIVRGLDSSQCTPITIFN